jgi:N-acyl-D-amino-acid deacylase
LYGYHGPINWASFGEYLEVIRQMGTSANLAWFVGHNTMRVASGVSGPTATEDQLREMERFVAEAMDAGALGMSTGLEYGAGREAQTPEIVRLAKVVGARDGYYASHIRNRDAHLQEAVDEFLTIAREGGRRAVLRRMCPIPSRAGCWSNGERTAASSTHCPTCHQGPPSSRPPHCGRAAGRLSRGISN